MLSAPYVARNYFMKSPKFLQSNNLKPD
jgi:hypothetical protein